MTAPPSTWELSLAGGPPEAIARWLLDALFGGRAPQALSLDFRRRPAGAGWAAQLLADSRAPRGAFFDGPGDEQLVLHPAGTVVATVAWSGLPTDALGLLAAAPFEVAAFGSRHASWRSGRSKYLAPGFGQNHVALGWGCAFKGKGHDRLVTRRWLDFGPWRLLRGQADTSLVQFHAWQADAKTALAQARPGHALMGIGESGGYLQRPYPFSQALHGLYDRDQQSMRVVVTGRRLSQRETLDACAALKQGRLAADQPLQRLIYVFPEPDQAQLWLHALWLRGLECWTIQDGVETRLDATYAPAPPPPPAWVANE